MLKASWPWICGEITFRTKFIGILLPLNWNRKINPVVIIYSDRGFSLSLMYLRTKGALLIAIFWGMWRLGT